MLPRPFEYSLQRPDGTHQTVSESNPVPVTVRGLPQLGESVSDQIAWVSQLINATMIANDDKARADAWHYVWSICGQIEKTRKAAIWLVGVMGLLQLATILAVVMARL